MEILLFWNTNLPYYFFLRITFSRVQKTLSLKNNAVNGRIFYHDYLYYIEEFDKINRCEYSYQICYVKTKSSCHVQMGKTPIIHKYSKFVICFGLNAIRKRIPKISASCRCTLNILVPDAFSNVEFELLWHTFLHIHIYLHLSNSLL